MNKERYALRVFQFTPVITSLVLWVHEILYYIGIDLQIAENTVKLNIVPAIALVYLSKRLKFCWLHKILTYYTLWVSLCITYNDIWGFKRTLEFHQIAIIATGAILFILMLTKMRKFINNCIPKPKNDDRINKNN